MRLGDVFFWETDKASGYAMRQKYHLFICEEDWEFGNTFLFISSDDRGGDYKITNPPYTFLTKPESFVTSYSVVCYASSELAKIGQRVGALTTEHLRELHWVIAASEYMEGGHIKRVCGAIRAGVGGC